MSCLRRTTLGGVQTMKPSDNQQIGFYRCMRLIRRFDERVVEIGAFMVSIED